jgi:hypothetical protein
MRVIVHYHDSAQRVINDSAGEKKITWAMIYQTLRDLHVKVTMMKFELPRQPDSVFKNVYGALVEEISTGFRNLQDNM